MVRVAPRITRRTGLKSSQIHDASELLLKEAEGHFQARVVGLAKTLGWRRIYHPWSSLHSASGFPDLVLCKPPRALYVELKTERGRITPAQQGWLDDLAACPGHEVPFCARHNERGIWRPGDWPDLVQWLQGKQP